MSNIHCLSWKLVSQFISWDFCRYTSEQAEGEQSENDVLTYLRNMIVERTERAASQVSEHEVIAKFIMEAKTIRTLSRMSCLENLAESIKKMCPDLNDVLQMLLAHLECFLEALESNENSENREMLESRMSLAIYEFSSKACKILPDPLLLKILKDWQLKKSKGLYPKDPVLYRKVLTCLQEEVKSFEVTVIANALYDDEPFKRVLCSGLDSQDFSIISSQPLENSCPNSLQLSENIQMSSPHIRSQYLSNSLSFEPSNKLSDSQQSLLPPCIPLHMSSPHKLADKIDRLKPLTRVEALLFENPNPTPLFQPPKSPLEESRHRTGSFSSLVTSDHPLIINVRPFMDREESADDSDSCYPTQRPMKIVKSARNKVFRMNESSDEEDTSDCDKDPEIRLLTPTLFKKGQEYQSPKVIYLSDEESFGSSIITNFINSQENDPSFKPKCKIRRDDNKNNKHSKKVQKTTAKVKSKNQKPTKQTTLRNFVTTTTKRNKPVSLNDSRADFQKHVGKKKKLFNQDAPSTSTAADASSSLLIRKRKSSKEINSLGNKRHCSECKITFRTPNELKKHAFIFHTHDDLSS